MSERAAQIDRVAKLLTDGINVALHGAPRTGKTWISDEATLRVRDAELLVVRTDLSLASSGAGVFADLRQQFSDSEVGAEMTVHPEARALRKLLQNREKVVCVVMDEFDSVVRFADSLDFLRLLRELIHRPSATHCSVLITSRRSLAAIESEVRGISTLATVCVQEYARAVEVADLRAVWTEADGLAAEELSSCLEWSAGHPSLVRYWLSARPDMHPSAHSEHCQITEFQRLSEHLDRAGLGEAAAQLTLGPVVDDWFIEAKDLRMLGVLGDGDGASYGDHPVFQECLRHRYLGMNPWGVLGAVEVQLRSLIEDRLSTELGGDWVEAVQKQHRAVARMLTEAAPKQANDERKFGRSGSWLAYTYPKDLAEIIFQFWTHFDEVFVGGDKQYWKIRLDAVATYRTPVAHNRVEVLSDDARAQCRIYAEQVLRAIATHYGG